MQVTARQNTQGETQYVNRVTGDVAFIIRASNGNHGLLIEGLLPILCGSRRDCVERLETEWSVRQ